MDKSYRRVLSKHKKKLLSLNHVVGVGFGKKVKNRKKTNEDSIVVLVDKKLPVEELHNQDIVPEKLDNFKTDVQEVGTIKLLKLPRTERFRPAPGGVSVGHYKITAGTLGAIVKDKKTGEPLILSNNHVLANITNGHDGKAEIGDPILQPGSYDNGTEEDDVIGELVRYIPLNPARGIFDSPENIVDCALARPLDKKMVENSILGIGKVKGIKEPEIGMRVVKSGRTTGITEGTIQAIDSTISVKLDDEQDAFFSDQVLISSLSQAGDSGSLILDTNQNAVGLLFAGSDKVTVCNKITNVMNELEIEFFEDGKDEDEVEEGEEETDTPKEVSFGINTIIFLLFILVAMNFW